MVTSTIPWHGDIRHVYDTQRESCERARGVARFFIAHSLSTESLITLFTVDREGGAISGGRSSLYLETGVALICWENAPATDLETFDVGGSVSAGMVGCAHGCNSWDTLVTLT